MDDEIQTRKTITVPITYFFGSINVVDDYDYDYVNKIVEHSVLEHVFNSNSVIVTDVETIITHDADGYSKVGYRFGAVSKEFSIPKELKVPVGTTTLTIHDESSDIDYYKKALLPFAKTVKLRNPILKSRKG